MFAQLMANLVYGGANKRWWARLQDLDELKAVPWDLVVLDERHASKSFAHKMYPVLLELRPRLRVSMRDMTGDYTVESLLPWAMFIKPHLKVSNMYS